MPVKTKALKNFFGFKPQLHTVEGKSWLCLVLNDPNNQYGFKGDKFEIDFLTLTGYVSEDNQHWLLGTVTDSDISAEGVYEFDAKKQGDKINEKTGKATWIEDSELNEKLKTEWKASGNLVAIKCDDMPTLKVLAKALHTTKYLSKNKVTCYIRESSEEQQKQLLEDLTGSLQYLMEKGIPTHTEPEYQKMVSIAQAGLLTVPFKSATELPNIQLKDIFGNPTETIQLSIPFKGVLPKYDSIPFTVPAEPVKKAYTPQGSVNAVYTLQDRLTDVCNVLKNSGVPLENDNIASIQNAIASNSLHDTYYRIALQLSGVPIPLDGLTTILSTTTNGNGNGNINKVYEPVVTPLTTSTTTATKTTFPPFDEEDAKLNKKVAKYRTLLVTKGLKEEEKVSNKRSSKELDYLIEILESKTYSDQLKDLVIWILNNIGSNPDILALKEQQLAIVVEGIRHNENALAIDSKANISMVKI